MLKFFKKFVLSFIFLTFSNNMCPKTLIWDLDGVLFSIDKTAIMMDLGIGNLFKYIFFDWKSPYIEPVTFKVLESIGGKQQGEEHILLRGHNNEILPAIMFDWQSGKKTGYEIIDQSLKFINSEEGQKLFVSEYEKILVEEAIKIIFDPYNLIRYTKINSPGLRLLQDCANKKDKNGNCEHKLLVLSNRDCDSFALLKSSFPEVFKHFDDANILISADIGLVKPNPLFFQYLFDKYNVDPNDCIFFDDQLANIETARSLGIYSLHINGKFNKIRKELKHFNII